MGYFSDPTADRALGSINREFTRLTKKAKALRKLRDEGKISPAALERAQGQFTGIFRHVLTNVLNAPAENESPADSSAGDSPYANACPQVRGTIMATPASAGGNNGSARKRGRQ